MTEVETGTAGVEAAVAAEGLQAQTMSETKALPVPRNECRAHLNRGSGRVASAHSAGRAIKRQIRALDPMGVLAIRDQLLELACETEGK